MKDSLKVRLHAEREKDIFLHPHMLSQSSLVPRLQGLPRQDIESRSQATEPRVWDFVEEGSGLCYSTRAWAQD